MKATVYGIPGSHPVRCAELMLRRKGIRFRRIDLPPAASIPILRALRFRGGTVPAVRLDGARLQGTRTISRALDSIRPEPRLFPVDPEPRARVEAAEAWGDELLQPAARRIALWAYSRDRDSLRSLIERPLLGLPPGVAAAIGGPFIALDKRVHRVTDESVRVDLAELPELLDRVDGLIADGVLGGAAGPNAADFQIAPSTRLLMTLDDLRPPLGERPAGRHAQELLPDPPGRVGPVVPQDWLVPLRAGVPAA